MDETQACIAQMDGNGSRVAVFEYQNLLGSNSIESARSLYYAAKVGMRLRQVHILLNGAKIIVEAGALQYLKGDIRIDASSGGLAGMAQKALTSALTNEKAYRPTYTGTGEIVLEPSFGHFLLVRLENEEMVTDKSMFYASEGSVAVGVAAQKNISAALFGGDGFFQTKISGTGWVVLESPVPMEEIVQVKLNNEKLQVDGNFALLRKGKIDFRVERSTKSWLGSSRSGEGLLQTFAGQGEVWLAPTQSVYQRLRYQSLNQIAQAGHSSGQNT